MSLKFIRYFFFLLFLSLSQVTCLAGYELVLKTVVSPEVNCFVEIDSSHQLNGQEQNGLQKVIPNRFEEEIRQFELQDQKRFPPKGAVLFVGSSSIRLWRTLQDDFSELEIINRGFGGSSTADVLHFFDRIVAPYEPSTIVFFAGTNDLAGGVSPSVVSANTETFIKRVNKLFPGTKIIILSNTIAPVRKQFYKSYHETNRLLEEMIDQYYFVQYLDVTTPGLKPDGWPRPDIYTSDSLHLNEKGYQMWGTILRPLIIEDK